MLTEKQKKTYIARSKTIEQYKCPSCNNPELEWENVEVNTDTELSRAVYCGSCDLEFMEIYKLIAIKD